MGPQRGIDQVIEVVFREIIVSVVPQFGSHPDSSAFQHLFIENVTFFHDIEPFPFIKDIINSGIYRMDGIRESSDQIRIVSHNLVSHIRLPVFFYHYRIHFGIQITFVFKLQPYLFHRKPGQAVAIQHRRFTKLKELTIEPGGIVIRNTISVQFDSSQQQHRRVGFLPQKRFQI
ncbi:hypothetical protein SDC9_187211 [bioreactor metagenome]|uniref:Uncharacterized protein n=1 Tax=bioreactor metagenome TaxID=1076179 RepID=A0A645HML1_9ZZZZ